jgi:hypothetical protein
MDQKLDSNIIHDRVRLVLITFNIFIEPQEVDANQGKEIRMHLVP